MQYLACVGNFFLINIAFVLHVNDASFHNISEEFNHHECIQIHLNNELMDAKRFHSFPTHLNISFVAFNRSFLLILKQNNFLHSSYVEKHFLADSPIIFQPSINKNSVCLYNGYIFNSTFSVVALSICDRIRGIIADTDNSYHVDTFSNGRHFITRDIDIKSKKKKCGFHADKDHIEMKVPFIFQNKNRLKKRALHWPYDSDSKTRIVELYIANDFKQYENEGKDIKRVIQRTKETVNIVNSLYRPLDIYVILIGIEVWTNKDQIVIEDDADKTMHNFLKYRREKISPIHKNDNAQLITGHTFADEVVGKALKNVICSWQYSGGVNMDHSKLVGPVGTTMSHELGHNFGMEHDNVIDCKCPDDLCIMEASSSDKNPTKWSSCSIDSLDDAFHQGLDFCLRNLPDDVFDGPICGNGIVESGEECDCGLETDCTTRCCNPHTCQLAVNASCATGGCCDKSSCEILPAAVMCRSEMNDCDLPEYCKGDSEWCPSDAYLQNGNPCNSGQSYCYNGVCNYHEKQCQHLWGKTGHKSIPTCYERFNIHGDVNGNCGFDWTTNKFMECEEQDVMCGMLHCDHQSERLQFWREQISYGKPKGWVNINGSKYWCKGAILDVGLDTKDPGLVLDGTKCGEKMMCVQQKCQHFENLNIPICPDCNTHGVCNSKGLCHCEVGYAPPYCKGHGYGGSLHSGPIRIVSGTNVTLLACIVVLIFSLIGGFCLFYYRRKLKKMWAERPYKYDFLHRAKRTDLPSTATTTPVHTVSPIHGRSPSRKQSFRGKDISSPQLQFCTKTQSFEKMVDVGIQSRALPAIPSVHAHGSISNDNEIMAHQNFSNSCREENKLKSHPPRPAPPNILPILSNNENSSFPVLQPPPPVYNQNSVNLSYENKTKPPSRPPPTYIEACKSDDITIPKLDPPPQPSTPPLKYKFQSSNRKTNPERSLSNETNSYENVHKEKQPSEILSENHVYMNEKKNLPDGNKDDSKEKNIKSSNPSREKLESIKSPPGNLNKKPKSDSGISNSNKLKNPTSRPNLANKKSTSSRKDPSPTVPSGKTIKSPSDTQSLASNKSSAKPALPSKPPVKKPVVTPKPGSVKGRKPVVTKPSSLKLKSTTQSKLSTENKTEDNLA